MPPRYTIFGKILDEMLHDIPNARAAIFADEEGETVDMARRRLTGDSAFFDHQLTAAHWGVVYKACLRCLRDTSLGLLDRITLRFSQQQTIIARVSAHYYLILVLGLDADLQQALRLLDRGRERLAEEM
ncbi:MAG: hypothetical protein JRH20_06030 [Deltaproteobacteria bacterium]|nr:hypothetical protein [Deltaproteobacteria bacterium]